MRLRSSSIHFGGMGITVDTFNKCGMYDWDNVML